MSDIAKLHKIVGKKWDAIAITERPNGFRIYVESHRYASVETCAKHLLPYRLNLMGWDIHEGYYFEVDHE